VYPGDDDEHAGDLRTMTGRRYRDQAAWLTPCFLSAIALLLNSGCVQGATSAARRLLFVTFERGDRLACCGVALPGDGGIIVVGRADAIDGRSWAWATKVATDGSIAWEREWESSSGLAAASEVAGGAVIAVGHTDSHGLIVKIEPSGSIAWTRTLQLADVTQVAGVVADAAGGVVIAGTFRSRATPSSLFVAGVTGAGEIRGPTTIGPGDNYIHAFHTAGPNGYVMITGDWDVIRLNRAGRLLWRQKVENVWGVTGLSDGAVIVVHTSADRSFEGAALVRFDELGRQTWQGRVPAACQPRAIWSRPGDQIVVVSDPCDASGEMSIVTLSSHGEERSIHRLEIASRVGSLLIRPSATGSVIAAGMFYQDDGPNARKGWLFDSGPISSLSP
jgi:hypothetical protein